jgi:carbon-monoxide dehydrogenase large subunit
MDMEEALADGAPLVHESLGTNKSYTWIFDSAESETGGDVAAAIESAEVVLRRRYVQQRLIPAFMEPRSVVVDPTPDQITVWTSTQVPHFVRFFIAAILGTPEHKVRVIAPDVGGGFGGKLQITAEEFITFLAALRLGRPVKYTESRSESMLGAHHGRDMIQDVELAAQRDGTVTGLSVKLLANMGGYLKLLTPATPLLGRYMYNGIYKFPAHRLECTGVFTTTTPTDAYRGAGRPEATFAIERAMDDLAAELDMDPLELRRKNWITHDEFPFATVTGLTYDSGNYEAATDKAMRLLGYDELRREQEQRRASEDRVQLGIGISTYTEMCGLAPSRWLGSLGYAAGGWESAVVRMLPTGKVEVLTGTSPHGQGHETAWSQIVADQLGIPFDDVEVMHGDTRTAHKGLDTYGSRSLAVGGYALVEACKRVIEKAKPMAAHMLECDPSDLEFADGAYRVKGTPGEAKTITECALAIFAAHDLPEGVEPYLDADASYDPVDFSFPHGTHLCATEVDTETGQVTIRSYVAVDDIGRVVNPMIVEGQVHGATAHGISAALFEDLAYDTDGQLVAGNFYDYHTATAYDLPSFRYDNVVSPSPFTPIGAKGMGEGGGAPLHAISAAIQDAAGASAAVLDSSNPPERVLGLLRGQGAEKVQVLR